jgi:hypothetical protein
VTGARGIRRPGRAAVLAVAALAATAAGATAQGIRGYATTNVRYLTLRPVALDTVARGAVTETDGRFFDAEGHEVYCPASGADCTLYRQADEAYATVATQDISATAWGLGMQGLSATVLLRGRTDLGGDLTWPTADDHFDAILAYAELSRSWYRVRAGRQRTLSGLGFSGFDGLDLALTPLSWVRAEAYGGRSLSRGLAEPRHEALRGIEDFVLDQEAWLAGGYLELSPRSGTSLGARYQREIWANQVGLISERGSIDLRSTLPGMFRMNGSIDYDFAFGRVGKSHLTLQAQLPERWGWVELTARRYVPYFDLSTIWGYFSPTEFNEAELEATVMRFRPVTVWASAGFRKYGDPEISVIGPSITDKSQRYGVGARWSSTAWQASGEYRLETGFGAVLSSGDVSVRWTPMPGLALRARGSAFQQIEQFRLGDNTVMGAGLGAEIGLPFDARLDGGADVYFQSYENRATYADWDQVRAYTLLRVPFGGDPGMGGRR